jgi:hypothetical protein
MGTATRRRLLRGVLPQQFWPQQWRDDDRSDQSGNRNQPDTGNAMAPSGSTGGPDDTPMSGYDPDTVWRRHGPSACCEVAGR